MLRTIADDIEAGDIEPKGAVIVCVGDGEEAPLSVHYTMAQLGTDQAMFALSRAEFQMQEELTHDVYYEEQEVEIKEREKAQISIFDKLDED